jgi:aspartokinase/homoserine dehydrogenase 1
MTTNSIIPLFIFGVGNVGSTLIKQISERFTNSFPQSQNQLRIVFIANSKKSIFNLDGVDFQEIQNLSASGNNYDVASAIALVDAHQFQNPILIDVTASETFVSKYVDFIRAGFHIVAANKKANTLPIYDYQHLKKELQLHNRQFLYETNVGAGLPIIQTLSDLINSKEQIIKIRGVFSGSLSYIFNQLGQKDRVLSEILNEAEHLGLTEPDAREDLSGQDVSRKLLILARELGYSFDFSDVKITSLLVPELSLNVPFQTFQQQKNLLDQPFEIAKKAQKENHVLRYVGEFDVLSKTLEAKLVSIPKSTPLGQLTGTSNFFEITTAFYSENPIIIQGPGAGKEVTALGVLSDILKISRTISNSILKKSETSLAS